MAYDAMVEYEAAEAIYLENDPAPYYDDAKT